jgi:TonB dependent receptor
VIGNPDLRWEKVAKRNIGLDYSLFKGQIEGSFDMFKDERVDIFIPGNQRSVPGYFGGTPPPANLGKAEVQGYEIEVKLNRRMGKDLRLWLNMAMSHAKDKIIDRDDPQLLDDYQKQAGYQVGQYRSQIATGYYSTWDQLYGSVRVNADDAQKLPGNFNLLDFNGDGVIDNYDNVPYAYPERPQNTYTATLGFDYKRLSFMIQFYAVNNVTRNLTQTNFSAALNSVFVQGDYWSKDNVNAQSPLPRWKSRLYSYGDFFNYDGSYVRLKTAEISYTLNPSWLKKAGIKNMRLYVNGNNLLLWSKMPDDREANIGSSNFAGQGAYPTVRRINLGLNLSL